MDLEMTGLDPARNVIVEIATLVTDDQLELVAEGPDLVIHQPAEALDAMEDVVREMHTRSGLLAAIEASTISLADAGAATLDFIKAHVPAPHSVPLCGNSIGTDRRFLAAIEASTISLADAGAATLDFIKAHVPAPHSVPLCGNSIGTDRRFLAVYLPEIENFLHYRSIDVSTLKELALRWAPAVLEGAPKKESTHRALDDIRESVNELRW